MKEFLNTIRLANQVLRIKQAERVLVVSYVEVVFLVDDLSALSHWIPNQLAAFLTFKHNLSGARLHCN